MMSLILLIIKFELHKELKRLFDGNESSAALIIDSFVFRSFFKQNCQTRARSNFSDVRFDVFLRRI